MTVPHRATLALAREQLLALAAVEREWVASRPVRMEHEHDMRAGRYVVRARVTAPVPSSAAVLAGDVVRSLRTSLDEVATHLAGRATVFPIFDSLALFAQRARKAIAPMTDEAQASLEALQPYHAIGGYTNGPLWTLLQLHTHGLVRLAAGGLGEGGTMGINTARKVVILGDAVVVVGAFEDGEVVGSVASRIVGPDPKLDMFLRAELALAFAREGPGRGCGAVALLGALCHHVEHAVLSVLDPTYAAS